MKLFNLLSQLRCSLKKFNHVRYSRNKFEAIKLDNLQARWYKGKVVSSKNKNIVQFNKSKMQNEVLDVISQARLNIW